MQTHQTLTEKVVQLQESTRDLVRQLRQLHSVADYCPGEFGDTDRDGIADARSTLVSAMLVAVMTEKKIAPRVEEATQ